MVLLCLGTESVASVVLFFTVFCLTRALAHVQFRDLPPFLLQYVGL